MPEASPDPTRNLRVFLCHAHADKVAVRELYRRLKEQGVEPWLDDKALLAGQLWQQEIPKAVAQSDVVIVCLSEEFTRAGYRQREVKLALEAFEEQPPGAIFLIPARLENCETYEPLDKFQRVDLFIKGGKEQLLRALRKRARTLGSLEPSELPELGDSKRPAVGGPSASRLTASADNGIAQGESALQISDGVEENGSSGSRVGPWGGSGLESPFPWYRRFQIGPRGQGFAMPRRARALDPSGPI